MGLTIVENTVRTKVRRAPGGMREYQGNLRVQLTGDDLARFRDFQDNSSLPAEDWVWAWLADPATRRTLAAHHPAVADYDKDWMLFNIQGKHHDGLLSLVAVSRCFYDLSEKEGSDE